MILPGLISSALKLKYRLLGSKTLDISERLNTAERIIVFMPTKIEQFGAALKALERLRHARPGWHLTIICRLEMVSFIGEDLRAEIVPYSNEDINFLGLPKASIKQLFQKGDFDLALDFKLQFDPLTIILFQMSGAPLKVCIDTPEKAPFYNLGIRVNSSESLIAQYQALVKCLTSITGSPPAQGVEMAEAKGK